jgi:hypothetical protein
MLADLVSTSFIQGGDSILNNLIYWRRVEAEDLRGAFPRFGISIRGVVYVLGRSSRFGVDRPAAHIVQQTPSAALGGRWRHARPPLALSVCLAQCCPPFLRFVVMYIARRPGDRSRRQAQQTVPEHAAARRLPHLLLSPIMSASLLHDSSFISLRV